MALGSRQVSYLQGRAMAQGSRQGVISSGAGSGTRKEEGDI